MHSIELHWILLPVIEIEIEIRIIKVADWYAAHNINELSTACQIAKENTKTKLSIYSFYDS